MDASTNFNDNVLFINLALYEGYILNEEITSHMFFMF